MLEIGNHGQWGAKENMTTAERRSHMALWCIFAAPLILGGDVRTMSAGDLAIVANPKLIRIDQDPAGRQGRCLHGCVNSLQPWAAAALANFTAQNNAQRQIFPLPGPPLSLSRVRLGIFSQWSRWQPLVREIEFQTSDGAWKKNSVTSCAPNRTGGLVTGASGFVAPDTACLAADGNLSTHWNGRADQDQRYWIDFDFGGVVSLKAIAVTQGTDDVHQMKDFGLLPAPHGQGHESVQLWTKHLADKSIAVLLFNSGTSAKSASFNMSEIGLQCKVGDVESVWAVSNTTQRLSVVTATVESHDTAGFICSCSTQAMPELRVGSGSYRFRIPHTKTDDVTDNELDPVFVDLDRIVKEQLQKAAKNITAFSAVGVKDGKIAWTHVAGMSDFNNSIAVTLSTRFMWASVSKTVISYAAMLLVDRGIIDLDRDVSDCIGFTLQTPEHGYHAAHAADTHEQHQ